MVRFAPWLTLCLLGCATRTETVALEVRLSDDPACRRAAPVTEARITALGDFGGVGASAIVTDGQRIDRFPWGTEAFRGLVDLAGFRAEGVVLRDDVSVLRLVPLDVPCISALPAVPDGLSAIAPTARGGFVVVGGLEDEDVGTRVVRIVSPGLVTDRTFMPLPTRRVLATAHVRGARLFVVGGALGDTGPALDATDVIDLDTGDRLGGAVLTTPRRDHGAVVLSDGRVLVVGGRTAHDAPPLASAELVGESGLGLPTAELPFARLAPAVVKTDDGAVFVLGGLGAGGSPFSTASVFAWNEADASFTDRSNDVGVRPYARYVAVPLVGGRIVWVGDSRPGLSSSALRVFFHQLPDVDVPSLTQEDLDLGAQLPSLTEVVATPLLDGRFALFGLDTLDMPRGFEVDVGEGVARELDVPERVHAAITLADGSVAAFAETAIVTYRFRVVTPWDPLPETLAASDLAFDLDGHWAFPSGALFTALVPGARFDIPTVRFSDFEADIVVQSGSAELWLVNEHGLRASVSLREDEIAVGLCAVPRLPGEQARIVRRGTRLTLETSQGQRTCTVPTLTEEVRVAVRASLGATVRAPTLRRR